MADSKTAKCRICGGTDSLKGGYYRGPWGHFLRDRQTGEIHEGWDCCWECWLDAWASSRAHSPDRREHLRGLAANGAKQAEIARKLHVSVRTVQREFARLRKKTRKKRN